MARQTMGDDVTMMVGAQSAAHVTAEDRHNDAGGPQQSIEMVLTPSVAEQ